LAETPTPQQRGTIPTSKKESIMKKRTHKTNLFATCLIAALLMSLASAASAKRRSIPRKPHPIQGVCNINKAPLSKLMVLPYVGRSRGKAIIQHRKAHKFRHARDLMKVKGIGRHTFKKIKKHVVTTGPTTIRRVKRKKKTRKR